MPAPSAYTGRAAEVRHACADSCCQSEDRLREACAPANAVLDFLKQHIGGWRAGGNFVARAQDHHPLSTVVRVDSNRRGQQGSAQRLGKALDFASERVRIHSREILLISTAEQAHIPPDLAVRHECRTQLVRDAECAKDGPVADAALNLTTGCSAQETHVRAAARKLSKLVDIGFGELVVPHRAKVCG